MLNYFSRIRTKDSSEVSRIKTKAKFYYKESTKTEAIFFICSPNAIDPKIARRVTNIQISDEKRQVNQS